MRLVVAPGAPRHARQHVFAGCAKQLGIGHGIVTQRNCVEITRIGERGLRAENFHL